MTREHIIRSVTSTLAFAIIIMLACLYMFTPCLTPCKRTVEIDYTALHEEVRCAQERLKD